MCKRLSPLLPPGLSVVQVLPSAEGITILTAVRSGSAVCPDCGRRSHAVHSRYERRLADLPWQGRAVLVRVRTRRFFCRNPHCRRLTFAEPLTAITARSARRTSRLADLQRLIGLAAGGEAGARLLARIAMPISATTVLRLLVSQPVPVRATPRVLGVDEWAWRRGHRYGTALVDLEANRIVDLLPDRAADSFAAWLRAHPGVEMIVRDRGGAYADGASLGAPAARQVSDRWHLLRNVGDALREVVEHHHATTSRVAREVAAELKHEAAAALAPFAGSEAAPPSSVRPLTALEQRRAAAKAERQARHDAAVAMTDAGLPLASIAAHFGKDPRTIRHWLRMGHPPWADRRPGRSILDPYRGYLEQRFADGCRNATRLWREICAQGFAGRPGVVKVLIGRWRRTAPPSTSGHATRPGWKPPSMRKLTRLLTSNRAEASAGDQRLCTRLLEAAPELAAAVTSAERLMKLLRRQSSEPLADVLAAMAATPLARLAKSLTHDQDAVQGALDTPWTTSPVEGQICRIKLIKRQMYGRAGFPLLRQRVMEAA